jgi:cardiolipin synthase
MARASARGVRVRLLLEAAPVGGVSADSALAAPALARWNASGVEAHAFAAGSPNPARNHAKFLVADGRRVLVSTENFVGAALTAAHPNTGYALALNSTELAGDLLQVFEWDLAMARPVSTGRPGVVVPLHAPDEADAGASRAGVLVSPRGGPAEWAALVDSAAASVTVASLSADAETLGPASALGSALIDACKRGVEVRLLLAAGASSAQGGNLEVARSLAASAHAAGCGEAFDARVDPRAPGSGSVLHAKVLAVDGRAAIIGSHNLVAAAFAANREVSVLLESAAAVSDLEAALSDDFKGGEPVEAARLELAPLTWIGSAEAQAASAPPAPMFFVLAAAGAGAIMGSLWLRRRPRRRPRRTAPPRAEADDAQPLEPEAPAPSGLPDALGFHPRALPPDDPAPPEPARPLLPPSALDLFRFPGDER